uniref:peptidoglycan D,D-transpeptidase FtsI family protein n=1 Tax=Lachnospira sp. TaxID=2049031 RepID=UPI003FEE8657
LILDPKLILSDEKYKEPTLTALTECFDLKRSDLESILATKSTSQYEKLLKELTKDEISEFESRVEDTKNNPYIKGVWFEDSYIRKYPFSTLAADVIGFASAANGGELGLENYYDEELSGTDGISYSYVGENLDVETQEKKAEDGYNLVTTIDYKVQSIIENKIKELNAERPSKSTAVIAMNPKTGEILAMASYPTFNLNNPRDLSGVYTQEELSTMTDIEMTNAMYALWSNYCVSTIYEPGSTFKPFTVAEGLEEGVIHDGDTFYCGGFMEVSGSIINCHEHSGHGTVTVKEGLIQSCNPTMMQIAAKLGGVKIAKYEALFGFGNRTGIDLPGEEAGLTIGEKMTVIDAACNSFGQNINVNMVQMAAAFSSLVNGGNYYQPHIVKRIEKSTGEVVKTIEPNLVRQTVTSETSQLLRTYLRAGVDEGLARKSGVAGYAIGGKTGTAQKQPREDKKWVVSYIGCAPTDDPQLVLYTVIDEPFETNGTSGSSLDALNLSRSIYEEALPYLNIYKDIKAEPVDTTNSAVESTVELPDTTNTNNN